MRNLVCFFLFDQIAPFVDLVMETNVKTAKKQYPRLFRHLGSCQICRDILKTTMLLYEGTVAGELQSLNTILKL